MKKFAFLAFLLLASACAPTEAVRGNIVQDYQLKSVQAGVDTQSDVMKKLGSPTTKAPFDENIWYYMGQRTEKHGILDPQVVDERIVQVTFGQDGLVESVQASTPERVDIPYDRDKTPTSGQEMTVMQQVIGNMGRFNKSGAGGSAATTGSGGTSRGPI